MSPTPRFIRNPDLDVGAGNKQRWNQPAHRRHGFHHAHLMFRRVYTARAPQVLPLELDPDTTLANQPAVMLLTRRPEFSALVCARGNRLLYSRHAPDFLPHQPHSIQSISKMCIHLIAGRLIAEGALDPAQVVEHYLPGIGSGFRGARIQDVLDMNLRNDFKEDYQDPNADSYAEEVAMGWRLPAKGQDEPTLEAFVTGITGGADLGNPGPEINYCSVNTDLLTVICDRLRPGQLPRMVDEIAVAAGLENGFHISLSPEGLPCFSGGGCLSAADLARFGMLLARQAQGSAGFGDPGFTRMSLTRPAKTRMPPLERVRYSNHAMTDGRWIGHAGYGGQFLMADSETGIACAYLSVLENDSGYCVDYMNETISALESVLKAAIHGLS